MTVPATKPDAAEQPAGGASNSTKDLTAATAPAPAAGPARGFPGDYLYTLPFAGDLGFTYDGPAAATRSGRRGRYPGSWREYGRSANLESDAGARARGAGGPARSAAETKDEATEDKSTATPEAKDCADAESPTMFMPSPPPCWNCGAPPAMFPAAIHPAAGARGGYWIDVPPGVQPPSAIGRGYIAGFAPGVRGGYWIDVPPGVQPPSAIGRGYAVAPHMEGARGAQYGPWGGFFC
ncbi:hypothetical protein H9P43_006325 [Blastocladiella emersonii ATCC 22665]|nr:hypothetical protein H9P43_006325 [Blastocladiella emersonii ATCC 22665]